jgi:transglutaminase-like putative cysteine protease
MKKLVFLMVLLILPSLATAKGITNPQVVSKMSVGITENGSVDVSGAVYNLELNLSIPQEDKYQVITNFQVSDSLGPCNTDSCSFRFVSDNYGNKILSIRWSNPPSRVSYFVTSTVDVTRRGSIDKKMIKEFIEPTDLVQSTNPQIINLSSMARGDDFEKVSYLSKWIGENIQYDKVYSDVSLSATEILDLRKGVCKEFSNLLVSTLRNLGYYSAVAVGYVFPGRVYETNDFQPHGWVEVYSDSGIVADPVWSEVGYLDATHVKFATLSDSIWTFTSANANGLGDIKVKIGNGSVKLVITDFTEEPLIDVTTSLLSNNVWSNYSVLRTDMKANGCFLTKIEYKSCVDEAGRDFLRLIDPQNIVYFCNNKTVFTIFNIPVLDERKSYRCDIQIFPYAGTPTSEELVLNPKGNGYSKLVVEKNVLTPGERFTATAFNSIIFTDYGEFGRDKVQFTAPNYDFTVYSYNAGYLDSKNISVVLKKPIDVSIGVNDTALAGIVTRVDVSVKNLLSTNQRIRIIFKENTIDADLSGEKNISFNFTPKGVSDNLVQVFVSTPDFSTSASEVINVTEPANPSVVLSGLAQRIADFFRWLLSLFKVNL